MFFMSTSRALVTLVTELRSDFAGPHPVLQEGAEPKQRPRASSNGDPICETLPLENCANCWWTCGCLFLQFFTSALCLREPCLQSIAKTLGWLITQRQTFLHTKKYVETCSGTRWNKVFKRHQLSCNVVHSASLKQRSVKSKSRWKSVKVFSFSGQGYCRWFGWSKPHVLVVQNSMEAKFSFGQNSVLHSHWWALAYAWQNRKLTHLDTIHAVRLQKHAKPSATRNARISSTRKSSSTSRKLELRRGQLHFADVYLMAIGEFKTWSWRSLQIRPRVGLYGCWATWTRACTASASCSNVEV